MAPNIETIAPRIEAALKKVDEKITSLVSKLETTPEGFLTTDAINLQRSLDLRVEITKSFNPYITEAKSVTDYRLIREDLKNRFKKAGIDISFLKTDNSIIKAFSEDTFRELVSLGNKYAAEISEQVYLGAATGDSLKSITKTIEQLLEGGTDKAGRPLSAHATTIAETRYMEIDSTILLHKAEEYGLDSFKYQGSLIKESRKWCEDHKDKIFTLEEIRDWQNTQWQGKKAGDPFVVRGGWRCRHFWTPIKAKEDKDGN